VSPRWKVELGCRKVLAMQLGLTEEEAAAILPGEALEDHGLIDSLDSAECVLALEEAFDVDLEPYALAYSPDVNWTLGRLVQIVSKALELKGKAVA
jgi:acyl carrier protein